MNKTGFQAVLTEESKGVPCCGLIKQWSFFLGGLSGTITLQVRFSFASGGLRITCVCIFCTLHISIQW